MCLTRVVVDVSGRCLSLDRLDEVAVTAGKENFALNFPLAKVARCGRGISPARSRYAHNSRFFLRAAVDPRKIQSGVFYPEEHHDGKNRPIWSQIMTNRRIWLRCGTPSQPHAHSSPWDLQLSQLGHAAAHETLVTATVPFAVAWTNLFREMITDWPELQWRENGPGIGRDARIAYSSLLGRFVARAYLTAYEGVRVLVPLDEAKRALRREPYRIGKLSNMRGLEADWVGLDSRGRLVIAEAKGSFDRGTRNWSDPWHLPDVVRSAIGQARRTAVWSNSHPQPLPAKRWAIASRWANEENGLEPIVIAWDPDEGELDGGDYQALAKILHRADVVGVLTRLGHSEAVPLLDDSVPSASFRGEVRLRVGHRTMEPGFAAVVGPIGVHPLRSADDFGLVRRIREVAPEVAFASLSSKYAYTVMRASDAFDEVTRVRDPDSFPKPDDRFAQQAGLTVAWPKVDEELAFESG